MEDRQQQQNNEQVQPVQQIASSKTDVLGIISIVMSFIGFSLIGLILGLVGASKAKKENYSPVLSRIGWIIGLIFTIITTLILVVFLSIPLLQGNQRDTQTKNNMSLTMSEILAYQAENNGQLPTSLSELSMISSSVTENTNGEEFTYTLLPKGCTTNCRDFKLSTTLENGEIYEQSGY